MFLVNYSCFLKCIEKIIVNYVILVVVQGWNIAYVHDQLDYEFLVRYKMWTNSGHCWKLWICDGDSDVGDDNDGVGDDVDISNLAF